MNAHGHVRFVQLLPDAGYKTAFLRFEETASYYLSREDGIWQSRFWVSGQERLRPKASSISELIPECEQVTKSRNCFRFFWQPESGNRMQSWWISMYFTQFPLIEYVFDLGKDWSRPAADWLLANQSLDVVEDEVGKTTGNAFGMYLCHKVQMNAQLRKWSGANSCTKHSFMIELKQALMTAGMPSTRMTAITSLEPKKPDIRVYVSEWDGQVRRCLGESRLRELILQFHLPDWK